MCLYNPEKIDTERKDIKVYKVIIANADCSGSVSYHSPHFNSVWNIGETNHSEPFTGSHDESVVKWTINRYGEEVRVVSRNAFHSFKKLSDAIEELSFLLRWKENNGKFPSCDSRYMIGMFTIPGDSKYVYVGDTLKYTSSLSIRGFAKSYASESLRFDGLVPNGIYDNMNEDEKQP